MAIPRNLANLANQLDTSGNPPKVQVGDSSVVVTDTGSNGTIAFTTDNSERMRINASGNVGIGTTSPLDKLNVQADSTTSPSSGNLAPLIISGATSSNKRLLMGFNTTANQGYIQAVEHTVDYRALTLNPQGGNVGIGTSSPSTRLHVSSGDDTRLTVTDSGNSTSITIRADATNEIYSNTDFSIYTTGSNPIIFKTNNSDERVRITGGGFLKASNDGTYVSSTGTYHELKSTIVDYPLVVLNSSNASFSGSASLEHRVGSSASSTYTFYNAYSGGTADTEFKLRGDGNGYADGTWNNNGADYAEFFESTNGQALTLGATVVLEGTKVREATAQDDPKNIIGVVRPKEPSKASMVVGNTAWNKWANKYLTDDFDRYIMEDHDVVEWEEQVLEREAVAAVEAVVDEEGNEVSPAIPAQEAVYKTKQHSYESHNIPAGVTVPADAVRKTHDDKGNKFQHYKLNPAWDKDTEYVNRENRPEWNIIGLLGQVKILKGQPVGDRWIKMRDVSATVEEWMIR